MSTRNKKVKEPEVISDERLVTTEEVVAQEEFINEPAEELEVEQQKEHVNEFWNKVEEKLEEEPQTHVKTEVDTQVETEVEMGVLFDEPLKEVHFEFQDNYFLGTPDTGKETKIDALPEEPVKAPEKQERKKKTFEQMSACEMNIYHKTGIIPFY